MKFKGSTRDWADKKAELLTKRFILWGRLTLWGDEAPTDTPQQQRIDLVVHGCKYRIAEALRDAFERGQKTRKK